MFKRILCMFAVLTFISQAGFAQNIVFEKVTSENRAVRGGVLNVEGEITEVAPAYSVSFFNNLSFDEYVSQYVCSEDELPEEITGLDTYNMELAEFLSNYYYTVLKHPEMLAITGYKSIGYSDIDGKKIVNSVKPVYVVDGLEAAKAARNEMQAAVKEYTDLAKAYDSDVEKLLVIHDKMVADCIYDERVLDETQIDNVPYTVFHAVGVLCDKTAVCQGYSQALYMIAKEIGIEFDFCISDKKKHMWNFVKLNGNWYHMDMTNDDQADAQGRASHTYFLVSETGLDLAVHGDDWRHYGGGETYKCTDTKYETDHLFNLAVPFTAQRADDGYFHVPMQLDIAEWGVSTTVEFKSKSLYTGPVVSQYFIADRTYTDTVDNVQTQRIQRDLNIIAYPTRTLENTMLINRYDNQNAVGILSGITLLPHELCIVRTAQAVPENVPISFTGFFWGEATLTPYAEKAVWSQE